MKCLVLKAQKKHDQEAFVKLMEQNRQSMIKVARSYLNNEEDVADAVQASILACYEKLDTLRQPQYFKTWLIRIVINKCKDILRQNREIYLPDVMPEPGEVDTIQADLEFVELLQEIDEKYRTILVLYYAEGFNTREIAELLELNENTVKTRLTRAREQFARQYQSGLRVV
ncbi:MAG: sigma-70 family RNA polymerase sigma factor [Eubacteriales bacterium]|nr:sigma-70 family RNA polymerase sigma factor [Eubacteriales bacterium]